MDARVPGQVTEPPPHFVSVLSGYRERFEEATLDRGLVTLDHEVAGLRIRFECAGELVASAVGRSFQHLRCEPEEQPDLSIAIWDAGRAGARPPVPEAHPDEEGGATIVRTPFGLAVTTPGAGAVSLLSSDASGWQWLADVRRLPYWERAVPMRHIFHWWLSGRGRLMLHAGAVGVGGRGVLLAGPGGTGKSTTALLCLLEGFDYVGDDYLLLGDGPVAAPLFGTAKMKMEDQVVLPRVRPLLDNAERLAHEKGILYVNERLPERIVPELGLRAVVVPSRGGEGSPRLIGASPAVALGKLASSTIMQVGDRRQETLTRLAGMIGGLPAYVLETGDRPDEIPGAIARLLEELG